MKLEFNTAKNCFYISDPKEFSELTFSSAVLDPKKLAERIETLMQLFEKNLEAMQLLAETLKKLGAISVEFLPQAMMTATATSTRTGKISIIAEQQNPHDLLDSLVFELFNLGNEALNKAISMLKLFTNDDVPDSLDLAQVQKNAFDYAIQVEIAEYPTRQKTAELMKKGVEKYGWPKDSETVPYRQPCTLDEYLIKVKMPQLHHHGFSHFGNYVYTYYQLHFYNTTMRLETAIEAVAFWKKGRAIHLQQLSKDNEEYLKISRQIEKNAKKSIELDTAINSAVAEQTTDSKILAERLQSQQEEIRALEQQQRWITEELQATEETPNSGNIKSEQLPTYTAQLQKYKSDVGKLQQAKAIFEKAMQEMRNQAALEKPKIAKMEADQKESLDLHPQAMAKMTAVKEQYNRLSAAIIANKDRPASLRFNAAAEDFQKKVMPYTLEYDQLKNKQAMIAECEKVLRLYSDIYNDVLKTKKAKEAGHFGWLRSICCSKTRPPKPSATVMAAAVQENTVTPTAKITVKTKLLDKTL